MAGKLLSVVLTLLILGCPLWCSAGLCLSGSACHRQLHPVAADLEAAACCHFNHSHAGKGADASDAPLRPVAPNDCPGQHGECQCICGGAVLEPHDVGAEFASLATFALVPLSPCRLEDVASRKISSWQRHRLRASPPGRSTCILHQVFLI